MYLAKVCKEIRKEIVSNLQVGQLSYYGGICLQTGKIKWSPTVLLGLSNVIAELKWPGICHIRVLIGNYEYGKFQRMSYIIVSTLKNLALFR